MPEFKFDAYSPAEMAERVERVGVTKANLDFWSVLALGTLAGAFIAFGANLFNIAVHDSSLSFGLTQLVGGVVFSLGLVLVIIAGAELFTGNNLIVMAYMERKITLGQLLRNWIIVFIGNFLGSLAVVFAVYLSGQWSLNSYLVGGKALLIANTKVNLPLLEAFTRGVLCNTLVCLAVWLTFACREVVSKILAIVFPIAAFVAAGFEHSIANMYFIPLGLILKTRPEVIAAASILAHKTIDLSVLTWKEFIFNNLIPVTLGNIIGGAFLVGVTYWFIYLRPIAAEPVRRTMTKKLIIISKDVTVETAVKMMQKHNIGSILIGEKGNAEGILTDADITRKVVATGRNPSQIKVSEVMSKPLISVDVKTPIHEVYRIMRSQHIRHLVITKDGKEVGIVSARDLLRESLIR